MFRRLITASVVSLALAVSTGTAALAATAAPGAATAAPAVSAANPTAPSSAPTFMCEPGIVTTVCQIVFGPICRNHCYAAKGAAVAQAASAPTMVCAPGFEILCTVLALTVCRHGCGLATSVNSAPLADPAKRS